MWYDYLPYQAEKTPSAVLIGNCSIESFNHYNNNVMRMIRAIEVEDIEQIQEMSYFHRGTDSDKFVNRAAAMGKLKAITALYENNFDFTHAMTCAIVGNHFEIVRFLHENNLDGCLQIDIFHTVTNNNLELFRYLIDNDIIYDSWKFAGLDLMEKAMLHGHMDFVRFLGELFPTCNQAGVEMAASEGHLEVVQYAFERYGSECLGRAIDKAYEKDHTKIIQYLEEKGEEISEDAKRTRKVNDDMAYRASQMTIWHKVTPDGRVIETLVDDPLMPNFMNF